jgi:aminopeptidase C
MLRLQTAQSFQMTDSVQLKLRQRANIMLKGCELAESYRPKTDKAMTLEDKLRVDEIYRLLNRVMDLPPAVTSWLDD